MLLQQTQAVTSIGVPCCASPATAAHVSLYSSEGNERLGASSLMNWFNLGRVCNSGALRFDFPIAIVLFPAIIRKVIF